MNLSLWQGRRVLLTGHTGFKGAWLSLWLRRMGAEVTGYALDPPSEPNLFELARVGEEMDDRRADLRDLVALARVFAEARPEVVLHLAAQSLVREGYREPIETFEVNALGTAHLLQAVRDCPTVRAVVVVTTDKCYENREWAWGYRESDALGGRDPYAASKACAEIVSAAMRRSYFGEDGHGAAIATARAGNVIGGGDWGADRLLPDVLASLAGERPLRLRSPGAVRPWQHVLEPLSGYLTLAEKLWEDGDEVAEGWNFGPEPADARPVSWIVGRMQELWGGEQVWQPDEAENPHEARFLKLDISKARGELGWSPRLPLEEALAWVVEWHRAFLDGGDLRAVTLEQIDRYAARLG